MRNIIMKDKDNEREYFGIRYWMLPYIVSGIFMIGHGIGFMKAKSEYSTPQVKQVQNGFIPPSEIEIICEDLDKSDGSGLPETYININDEQYILIENLEGEPQIKKYDIIPQKIIPNRIIQR